MSADGLGATVIERIDEMESQLLEYDIRIKENTIALESLRNELASKTLQPTASL